MGASESSTPAEVGSAHRGAGDVGAAGPTGERTTVRMAVACAVVGILVAVALVLVANRAFASGAVTDGHLQTLLAYGATWVPMLLAVAIFALARRGRGVRGLLGIRFGVIDLLWGAAIGMLARFVAAGVSLALYGTTGLVGQPTVGGVDGWYVFGALIAPVVIAPLVEEGFFRGLMQGALVRWFAGAGGSGGAAVAAVAGGSAGAAGSAGSVGTGVAGSAAAAGSVGTAAAGSAGAARSVARTTAVFGIGVTTVVFVAVHLIGVTSTADALAIGAPLLVFAVAAGASRVLTGRIGAAVIGHIVFNGVAVLLTWPW